jgi:hypothetical protein
MRHPEKVIAGLIPGILVIREPRFTNIGSAVSTLRESTLRALRASFVQTKNKPNKALEPTITSVTPPAGAGVAPAALVAHL